MTIRPTQRRAGWPGTCSTWVSVWRRRLVWAFSGCHSLSVNSVAERCCRPAARRCRGCPHMPELEHPEVRHEYSDFKPWAIAVVGGATALLIAAGLLVVWLLFRHYER